MHPTASDRSYWTPERLDRLARGMFPVVFGRSAPEGDHVLADEDNEPAGGRASVGRGLKLPGQALFQFTRLCSLLWQP